MDSHPMGLDVWLLIGLFVYFILRFVWTAKALARLCGLAGSPEPSLVAYVISTIISWAGSNEAFYKIPCLYASMRNLTITALCPVLLVTLWNKRFMNKTFLQDRTARLKSRFAYLGQYTIARHVETKSIKGFCDYEALKFFMQIFDMT